MRWMTPGRWGLLAGLAVALLLWGLFRPVDCVGHHPPGDMDPSEESFWKECSTPTGMTLTLPYNPKRTRLGAQSYREGPTTPNNPPVIMVITAVGVIVALGTTLTINLRRKGLDGLLTPTG